MPPSPESEDLLGALGARLDAEGLSLRGVVPVPALRAAIGGLSPALRTRYGLDRVGGALAVALPYGEGPAEPVPWVRDYLERRPGPLAAIGRFARANWYKELVARLKAATAGLKPPPGGGGRGPRPRGAEIEWRCLANSGLPEKRLALAAGIGVLGRQGLVLVPGAGPACVLGLLLTSASLGSASGAEAAGPSAGGGEPAPRPGEDCGNCVACIEACPSGALSASGYQRELCLQRWSTRPGPLPPPVEAVWGNRLYGCDSCIEVCPRFRPDPGARTALGLLGPGLPASWLAEAGEAEIRARLRGSALGLGWMPIEAFRRNAELALRDADPSLRSPG